MDTSGPAVEFNWGALPNVHLHIIVPLAAILPSNNPRFAPAGTGPSAFGMGDIETGIKYRFVQETKHRPQIGTFTMFELPTWKRGKGLGSRQNLVQGAPLGAEEFWPLDHLWRRRRDALQQRGRLSQLSVCRLAGAARLGQKVDARHRGVLSRSGRFSDAPDQIGRCCWTSAATTNFAIPVFNCCSATATPSRGSAKITPTWGCIGLGANRQIRKTPPRAALIGTMAGLTYRREPEPGAKHHRKRAILLAPAASATQRFAGHFPLAGRRGAAVCSRAQRPS